MNSFKIIQTFSPSLSFASFLFFFPFLYSHSLLILPTLSLSLYLSSFPTQVWSEEIRLGYKM